MAKISFEEAVRQVRANKPELTELDLSGQRITLSDFRAFCAALKGNTHLESLDLSHCHLGAQGGKAIAAALPHSGLKTLHLAGNNLGMRGAEALCQGVARNPHLTALPDIENENGICRDLIDRLTGMVGTHPTAEKVEGGAERQAVGWRGKLAAPPEPLILRQYRRL